jgi:hypothetical protein
VPDSSRELSLEFHVDPQFIHRPLAAQALRVDQYTTYWKISDQITAAVVDQKLPDLRLVAVGGDLSAVKHQIVTIQSGFYFRRTGSGASQRINFRDQIKVDQKTVLTVEGILDPSRFETNSARGNLSGRKNVLIVGVATEVQDDSLRVAIRPLLIGIPFFSRKRESELDKVFRTNRPEIYCGDVDQFHLDRSDLRMPASASELERLFAMSEQSVKESFGGILGLSSVPADWGGESSDLVAHLSVSGVWGRGAFAFKGPGGKHRPWTLYPANMGHRGDQAVRLFAEPADIMIVQHCSMIAESVRHVMEALAVKNQKRFILIDGDHTVRILRKAGLLLRG